MKPLDDLKRLKLTNQKYFYDPYMVAYYKFNYDRTDSSKLTNLSPYNYGQREL